MIFVDTAMDPKPGNESGNHPNEIIQLHVVVKNLQSIQTQTRFEDFMVEVDDADFDVLLLTETWRSEREEFYKTNGGQNLFLSGSPLGHAGVGICISKALSRNMVDVTFHAYSEGFAPYTCHLDTRNFRFLHVTFLLHGLRMLMLKVCMNCWTCSSRIAGNLELFQS